MKTKPIQRPLSLLSALALLLTVFAVPAFAAGPAASAALDVGDRLVTAGTTNVFDVTVTNNEPAPNPLDLGGGDSINWVVVSVSPQFAALNINAIEVPAGWDPPREVGTNRILFRTSDADSAIAPGESVDFAIGSSVLRPTGDREAFFTVDVSADNGANTGSAAGGQELLSTLRILEIDHLSLTDPILNATAVTDGQDNTVIEVEVVNQGAESETLVPELQGQGDGSFTVLTEPDPQEIPGNGGSATFDFPVSFARTTGADADQLTLTATAQSDDAFTDTPDTRQLTLAIERALNLTYTDDTLDPTSIAAGFKDISLILDKTGVPAADGLSLTATFTNGSSVVDAPVPVSVDLGRNADTTGLVTFLDVPFGTDGLAGGEYTIELAADGTDANGAVIDLDPIAVDDKLLLDLFAPVIDITEFLAPASRVDGEDDAATEGESFTLRGTVTDQDAPCGDCTVTGTLRIGTAAAYDVEVPVNGDGSIDTTVPVTGAPTDVQNQTAFLTLVAQDATGDPNHTDTDTDIEFVDTRAPMMADTAPLAGGLAQFIGADEDPSRVDVLFPEGIDALEDTSALNWAVRLTGSGDNLVTAAEIATAPATEKATVAGISFDVGDQLWFVQLTLNDELDGNAEGTVTYQPNSRVGVGVGETLGFTRIFDRVDLGLAFGEKDLIDNIAPDLPIIGAVAGKALQTDDDGTAKFFTNATSSDVTVTSLEPASTVELWRRDTDGGDPVPIATSPPLTGNSYTFEAADLGPANNIIELYGVAKDSGLKVSTGLPETTRVDLTAPEAVSAVYDGGDNIRLATDEGLVGPYRGGDWFVTVTDGFGQTHYINGGQVTKAPETESYDLRQRDITLNVQNYDPGEGGNATMGDLFYTFLGDEGEQLADRAGNLFDRGDHETGLNPIDVTTGEGSGSPGAPAPSSSADNPVERLLDVVTRD